MIIETGTATYRTAVRFTAESISGIEALRLAGADPVLYSYSGLGAAVCALHGVGRPAGPNCLGGADGDPRYWAYFRAPAGTERFEYSRVGAGAVRVRPGDVEGWRWGTGQAPTWVPLDRIGGPPPTTTTRPPATTRPAATPPPGSVGPDPTPPASEPGGPGSPGPGVPPGSAGPGPAGATGPTGPDGVPATGTAGPGAPGDDGAGGAARTGARAGRAGSGPRNVPTGGTASGPGAAPARDGGRGGGPPVAGYLLFGALLTALGTGILTARRRRRPREATVPPVR